MNGMGKGKGMMSMSSKYVTKHVAEWAKPSKKRKKRAKKNAFGGTSPI